MISALPLTAHHALAFFATVLTLYLVIRRRRQRRLANPRDLPYPPGPKPYPIIGNLFEIARENEGATYQRLAKNYGTYQNYLTYYFAVLRQLCLKSIL